MKIALTDQQKFWLLALSIVAVTAIVCTWLMSPLRCKYRVVHYGDNRVILLDTSSGKTWRLFDRWKPLDR